MAHCHYLINCDVVFTAVYKRYNEKCIVLGKIFYKRAIKKRSRFVYVINDYFILQYFKLLLLSQSCA